MANAAEPSSSSSSSTAAALPVGFRFRPTDEELVRHYLKAKIAGRAHPDLLAIPDVDLAAVEPWDLPARSVIKSDDPEWFFFARRDRPKYPGNKAPRSCRSTAAGYWKATGKDRLIRAPGPGGRGKGALIGVKKTLVFHRGRAPRGARTPWIMHEYTATATDPQPQSQSQSGPQNDSFVLYRLFNKQDEETLAPISEPPSTSPPGNPPLHTDDDTASASMVQDEASPSDSSQLTPTNATTDHSSTAHLLAVASDAQQTADQEAAFMASLEQLPDIQLQAEHQRYDEFPTFNSPMRPYTDLPFIGNMGDEHDLSMYLDSIIAVGEQDVQDMFLNPAGSTTAPVPFWSAASSGSWTPCDLQDMGAAPSMQQPTAPADLMDQQQGIAARRIRLAYAVERASASQPILACHSESEEGEGESAGCSTESSPSNHEEDHVNDAVFQTMAGDLMHNMAPAQALLVSPVEVADKLQHLSFNDNSILEEEDAKPRRGASLKQRVKQDLSRNGHDQDGLLRNSGCLPGDSSSETARRHAVRRSLWLPLLVMAPLLVLVLVGVWRSLSYRPV